MKLQSLGMLAAAVFVVTPALAQEMPKPSPEMARLDFFEGSWSCQGTIEKSPMSPAGKISSEAQIRDDLGGFWQIGTIRAKMTTPGTNMPTFEGRFHTTYDPSRKQFVMLWVDDMGAWAQTTSRGWQKDTMVFEGESHMPGQKPSPTRDTFGRTPDGAMTHVWEMQMDGKWVKLGEETCRKK